MEAPSYREHELAFRTQYAGGLLPGTPARLPSSSVRLPGVQGPRVDIHGGKGNVSEVP